MDAQKAEADKDIKQRRAEISRQENSIDQKETALDRKTEALERKEEELKKRSAEAEERLAEIERSGAASPVSRGAQCAPLAQLVEQLTLKQRVPGSSP